MSFSPHFDPASSLVFFPAVSLPAFVWMGMSGSGNYAQDFAAPIKAIKTGGNTAEMPGLQVQLNLHQVVSVCSPREFVRSDWFAAGTAQGLRLCSVMRGRSGVSFIRPTLLNRSTVSSARRRSGTGCSRMMWQP